MTEAEAMEWMRRLRGIEEFCQRCRGLGTVLYGSTATWRGGVGAAAMTTDVCDRCWGSGDEHRHGVDLRRLRATEDQRVAERAAALLADRCGASLSILRPAIAQLAVELERMAGWRRPMPEGHRVVAEVLAKVLREMIGEAPKEEPALWGIFDSK